MFGLRTNQRRRQASAKSSTRSVHHYQKFIQHDAFAMFVWVLSIFLTVMHDLSETPTQKKIWENMEYYLEGSST
jgi:hypothetical protein